jgi:N-methylhydantoinase A/oxoprolinase/acetone carboxylase beta subunit
MLRTTLLKKEKQNQQKEKPKLQQTKRKQKPKQKTRSGKTEAEEKEDMKETPVSKAAEKKVKDKITGTLMVKKSSQDQEEENIISIKTVTKPILIEMLKNKR